MLSDAVPAEEVRQLLRREQAVYQQGGFGAVGGAGSKLCLLVVDVTYGFVGHGRPDDMARYPNWCGPDSASAVERIAGLLDAARHGGTPVIYTTGSFRGLAQGQRRLTQKHPRAARQPEDSYTVVERIAPRPGEQVLAKQAPSAFFGTPLAAMLISAGIDTLVVTGCSTSGCVRSTVVDAFSFGFPTLVVADAVFDRSSVGHEVSIFELGQKYADVCSTAEVTGLLLGAAEGREGLR